MIYKEEIRDLFSVSEDYYLAHCISADFALGAGIAVEFNKRFSMRWKLDRCFGEYLKEWNKEGWNCDCLLIGRVFNLVTKTRYWQKPSYPTLRGSLEYMKEIAEREDIKKIAMPLIGCGLDGLNWNMTKTIIQDVFEDTDIEILVCKLK